MRYMATVSIFLCSMLCTEAAAEPKRPGAIRLLQPLHGRDFSRDPYAPNSITNPYSRYGNPYSPESPNNPYGAGNPYQAGSPYNPFSRSRIYDRR